MNKEAAYYLVEKENHIRCLLCPHHCLIKPGAYGICQTRQNEMGVLYARNYAQVAALALDPIEKKPLNRYRPGSHILSVGTFGCNMFCPYCQNHSLARANANQDSWQSMSAEMLCQRACELKEQGNIGLAFTYNEPSVWFEYVRDTARLAQTKGLDVVLVTNGQIELEPLKELLAVTDAMNIDLKCFNETCYREQLGGSFKHVKQTIEQASLLVHVEVTVLMVPGMVSLTQINDISEYLSKIRSDIPLHISRFFPQHTMDHVRPTPIDDLMKAQEIAKKHLDHVYLGNS